MRYLCYDLLIDSDLPLPELHEAPAVRLDGEPDVLIREGALPEEGSAYGQPIGPLAWATPRCLFMRAALCGRFLIEDGRRITWALAPGQDLASLRLFLLGSALGALLTQRGVFVLHGNAIRVGDGALVCVGPSGAGKSTLAAGLLGRGLRALADDVVALDARGRVLPGLPRIKLWQDAAEKLALDTQGLNRLRPGIEKFSVPMEDGAEWGAQPLRGVYELHVHRKDSVEIEPVRGIERVKLLQLNLYRQNFQAVQPTRPEHLMMLARLSGATRVARVRRPEFGFALDALMDALLADLEA